MMPITKCWTAVQCIQWYFLEISTRFCCFSAHIPHTSAYSSSCLFIQTQPETEMVIPSSSKLVALVVSTGLNYKVGQRQSEARGSFKIYYLTIQLQKGTSQLSKHRNSPFQSFIFNSSGLQCWPFKFIISHYTQQAQLAVWLHSYTWQCSSRFYWHSLDPRQRIQLMTVHPLPTKLSYQLRQPFAQHPAKLR